MPLFTRTVSRHIIIFVSLVRVHLLPMCSCIVFCCVQSYRSDPVCRGEVTHKHTLLSQHTMDSIQLRAAAVDAATICRGSRHNLTRSLIIITLHERQTHYYANVQLKYEPLNMCQRARLRRLRSWFNVTNVWSGDNAVVCLPHVYEPGAGS